MWSFVRQIEDGQLDDTLHSLSNISRGVYLITIGFCSLNQRDIKLKKHCTLYLYMQLFIPPFPWHSIQAAKSIPRVSEKSQAAIILATHTEPKLNPLRGKKKQDRTEDITIAPFPCGPPFPLGYGSVQLQPTIHQGRAHPCPSDPR